MTKRQVRCANLRQTGELDHNYDRATTDGPFYHCSYFHRAINPSTECRQNCPGYSLVVHPPSGSATSHRQSKIKDGNQISGVTHDEVRSRLSDFERRVASRPDRAPIEVELLAKKRELESEILTASREIERNKVQIRQSKAALQAALQEFQRQDPVGWFRLWLHSISGSVRATIPADINVPAECNKYGERVSELTAQLVQIQDAKTRLKSDLSTIVQQLAELPREEELTQGLSRISQVLSKQINRALDVDSDPLTRSQWERLKPVIAEAERCFLFGISPEELKRIERRISRLVLD